MIENSEKLEGKMDAVVNHVNNKLGQQDIMLQNIGTINETDEKGKN